MCNENQNIGPLCQVKIENVDKKKDKFTVKPLHIKRIRFVSNANIKSVTSKSTKPGRYATIWVSKKCHLSLGEYEINGETVNETTEENPINIGWNTTEICVAIFNDNDVDATYFINIKSDDDKNDDVDANSSFESTDIPIESATESQILSQSLKESSSDNSEYLSDDQIITESRMTSKIVSFSDSDIISTDFDTLATNNSEIDNETNINNDKKIIIIIVFAVVLAVVIAIVATVIIVVSMDKNKNNAYSTQMTLFDKNASTFDESLLEK